MKTDTLEKQENGVQVVANQTPNQLIALAVQTGAGIDTIERLMTLLREEREHIARMEFFDALAQFQSKAPEILKTDSGHNSKYAKLGKIDVAIKALLTECGLTKQWKYRQGSGEITVACHVTHRGGHCEISEMSAPADTSGNKNAIQAMGSTVSYMERYTLKGALGLTTVDQDDDGKKGGGPPASQRKDITADTEENSKEFGRVIKGVIERKGKAKIADIEKHYVLTEEQKKKIELANKSATQSQTAK